MDKIPDEILLRISHYLPLPIDVYSLSRACKGFRSRLETLVFANAEPAFTSKVFAKACASNHLATAKAIAALNATPTRINEELEHELGPIHPPGFWPFDGLPNTKWLDPFENGRINCLRYEPEYFCPLKPVTRSSIRFNRLKPIHIASSYGAKDVLRWLIDNGADLNAITPRIDGEGAPYVVTALHLAKTAETVSALLDGGFDLGAFTSTYELDRLLWAMLYGVGTHPASVEAVATVLQRGQFDLGSNGNQGPPVLWAMQAALGLGHICEVSPSPYLDVLIRHGAAVAPPKSRCVYLIQAICAGQLDMVRCFVEQLGVPVALLAEDDPKDLWESTQPLSFAVGLLRDDVVEYLLGLGRPEIFAGKKTPTAYLARMLMRVNHDSFYKPDTYSDPQFRRIIDLLLAHGAELCPAIGPDDVGGILSAYNAGRSYPHPVVMAFKPWNNYPAPTAKSDAVRFLVSLGFQVNGPGWSAFDYMNLWEHADPELIDLLLELGADPSPGRSRCNPVGQVIQTFRPCHLMRTFDRGGSYWPKALPISVVAATIDKLIAYGADPNNLGAGDDGWNALVFAICNGDNDLVHYLVQHLGADFNRPALPLPAFRPSITQLVLALLQPGRSGEATRRVEYLLQYFDNTKLRVGRRGPLERLQREHAVNSYNDSELYGVDLPLADRSLWYVAYGRSRSYMASPDELWQRVSRLLDHAGGGKVDAVRELSDEAITAYFQCLLENFRIGDRKNYDSFEWQFTGMLSFSHDVLSREIEAFASQAAFQLEERWGAQWPLRLRDCLVTHKRYIRLFRYVDKGYSPAWMRGPSYPDAIPYLKCAARLLGRWTVA
ncbi:hypothetical protein HDV64DRAFT_252725 [Trichoderma sp. TUCIM 5745]